MKSSLRQQEVDDGSGGGRLGEEEQHAQCCRTRQCDDLGCCFAEEEEVEEKPAAVRCGPPEAVLFPKVPFWRESLAQFLELKHRTKLKRKSPQEEFVSNVEFESQRGSRSCGRRWLKPAKLAWLVMASVLLFSVMVTTVPAVQGNEIRPSQVRPGLKKGGE